MRSLIRAINAISVFFGIVAAALIGASILIVCHMVILRYGLKASTTWQTDVVTYALVAATLLGSPYVLRQGGHITIDLVWEAATPRQRHWLGIISNLGTLAFALVLAIVGGKYFWDAWQNNWVSETVDEIPLWIPFLSLPVGFGLLVLQSLAEIASRILALKDEAVDLSKPAEDASEEGASDVGETAPQRAATTTEAK